MTPIPSLRSHSPNMDKPDAGSRAGSAGSGDPAREGLRANG